MIIREAEQTDANELVMILSDFKESLTAYEPEDMREFRKEHKSDQEIKEKVLDMIKNKQKPVLIADDNDIVGFIIGEYKKNDHLIFKTVPYGLLEQLWVREDRREKGIASRLKEELFLLFRAQNCRYVKLFVLDRNPAIRIYKRWGFEQVLDSMQKRL